MKRKALYKLFGILGIVLIFIVLVYTLLLPKTRTVQDISTALQASEYGLYYGECTNGIIKVQVTVEIKNHTITQIEIVKHRNGRGKPAEVITRAVIEQQSLDVDAITGATYSSNTIVRAIGDAITSQRTQ